MLKLTRRLVLTAMAGFVAASLGDVTQRSALAAPEPGQKAPDFTGTTAGGETLALSDLRGQKVILEWTNHDCPFVVKHYGTGNMQSLQKTARGKGVAWLTVISSAPGTQGHVDPARAQALTAERDAHPAEVLLDPEGVIGRLYNARTTPEMFLIDEEGVLVYAGAIDDKPTARWSSVEDANNYVRMALSDLVAGRPVGIPTATPYGCSIKYMN